MLIMLLFLFLIQVMFVQIFLVIKNMVYRKKINDLLKTINTKEDLLYLRFKDFVYIIAMVLHRSGYTVEFTDKCGLDGGGLKLNGIQFAEIWKHGLNQKVDVELAMNLAKCMQTNSVYRGMIVTLGAFKPATKGFCHSNVIECIDGDQLLNMCKAVRNTKVLENLLSH